MELGYIQTTVWTSDHESNKNPIQLRALVFEQDKFICCHVWILKKDFLHFVSHLLSITCTLKKKSVSQFSYAHMPPKPLS